MKMYNTSNTFQNIFLITTCLGGPVVEGEDSYSIGRLLFEIHLIYSWVST